jgi:hypothetical protein
MTPIIENDATKNMATPAVIIAAIRSGGTFLSHCLSNHTQIHCDRGEPLHHLSVWCLGVTQHRQRLLSVLLNQTGYQVSMVKLTYMQAFQDPIWGWLVKRQPRVIWLRRENVLRQALSVYLASETRQHGSLERPLHTFDEATPFSVTIKPALFMKYCRGLVEQDTRANNHMLKFERVLPLTYADVVGGELEKSAQRLPGKTTAEIASFLGVDIQGLTCSLRRVNPFPLCEMISNWPEVEAAIQASEFAAMLEGAG